MTEVGMGVKRWAEVPMGQAWVGGAACEGRRGSLVMESRTENTGTLLEDGPSAEASGSLVSRWAAKPGTGRDIPSWQSKEGESLGHW